MPRSACARDDLTRQLDVTQPASSFHTIAFTWVFLRVKPAIMEAAP